MWFDTLVVHSFPAIALDVCRGKFTFAIESENFSKTFECHWHEIFVDKHFLWVTLLLTKMMQLTISRKHSNKLNLMLKWHIIKVIIFDAALSEVYCAFGIGTALVLAINWVITVGYSRSAQVPLETTRFWDNFLQSRFIQFLGNQQIDDVLRKRWSREQIPTTRATYTLEISFVELRNDAFHQKNLWKISEFHARLNRNFIPHSRKNLGKFSCPSQKSWFFFHFSQSCSSLDDCDRRWRLKLHHEVG